VKSPAAPVAAGQAIENQGGQNGLQIGLGVAIGGVSTNFNQGSAQLTGVSTDFMIQGDGFFVANNGTENLFTRAGAFTTDAEGQLVTPDGSIIQGWMANATGVIDTNGVIGDIALPVSTYVAPVVSDALTVSGNIPKALANAGTVTSAITVYDALGTTATATATITKTGANAYTMSINGGAAVVVAFNAATGALAGGQANPITVTGGNVPADNIANGQAYVVDITGLTEYASPSSFAVTNQDGQGVGALSTFTTTADGQLIGVYSNGVKQPIAQLAVANFNNPNALEKVGDTTYRNTVNSGVALIGEAMADGRGSIQGGTLEMSNVDLAGEFTNLIVAQRGFAANSRTLTATDEMLQELMNIKR
jgi:flagellar hook protein FlgE